MAVPKVGWWLMQPALSTWRQIRPFGHALGHGGLFGAALGEQAPHGSLPVRFVAILTHLPFAFGPGDRDLDTNNRFDL